MYDVYSVKEDAEHYDYNINLLFTADSKFRKTMIFRLENESHGLWIVLFLCSIYNILLHTGYIENLY